MSVRLRFAPSPTGYLHVGGARTALFNWLYARHHGGQFILRIEDTDLERSTEASTDQILESMKWLGLDWDEGPFFQSKRFDLYREKLAELIAKGFAYRAFETPEELEAMRAKAMEEGRNPVYDRKSLGYSEAEVQRFLAEGRPFVWRFKCPPGTTDVPEVLMSGSSDCKFDNEALGDFALTRAGTEDNWGVPLYNFCCAVDDGEMGITHVFRGVEHLSNAPRQIMLLKAFGYGVPTYAHLPLITKNNKKMSKRDGDADKRFPVSVSARRDLGYLQEATVNFIALLGWSFDGTRELFTMKELVECFSLDGLSKSNANFDEDKYLHLNGLYMRNLPRESVVPRVKEFLGRAGLSAPERGDEWLTTIIGLEIERCRLLGDFAEALRYFFVAPDSYEEKAVKKMFLTDNAGALLRAVAEQLPKSTFTHDGLDASLRALAEARGLGFGKLAQPVRLALTGRTASPGLFEVMVALGPEECCSRLNAAADKIESGAFAAVAAS